jgi:hypothetical protein
MNASQNPGLISVSETTSKNVTEFKWPGHMATDIAATFGPDPFATLTATSEALVVSGTLGTFRVPRSAVKRIGRGTLYPWFFGAVRIHHNIPGFPDALQFKPIELKPREIIEQVAGLGYPRD